MRDLTLMLITKNSSLRGLFVVTFVSFLKRTLMEIHYMNSGKWNIIVENRIQRKVHR